MGSYVIATKLFIALKSESLGLEPLLFFQKNVYVTSEFIKCYPRLRKRAIRTLRLLLRRTALAEFAQEAGNLSQKNISLAGSLSFGV